VQRVCVFCGSRDGNDSRFAAAAVEMGIAIAEAGLGVVYGGGSVGWMGIVADAALGAGGEVIGVIPDGLFSREIAHTGLTELHAVPSLTARKALMAELSDAFIALPGGYGTLDELFEMITWTQLGIHDKPSGLLDVAGFFGDLLRFLDHVTEVGFVKRPLVVVDDDPASLLRSLSR
jgi:hypothetical protein